MLFLDVNVCLHGLFPDHSTEALAVTAWLNSALAGPEPVAVSEMVLASMIRIATHTRIFPVPSTSADAVAFAEALSSAPAAVRSRPGPRHWGLFSAIVTQQALRANLVPDAYLAASAMELGATLVTRDRGFRRFDGLRVLDPLG